MSSLESKIALITGAARGIGAAIAEKLASEGALAICADLLSCEETRERIIAAGGRAEARILDVCDHEAAANLIGEIVSTHGSLDILVNNAGITRDQLLIRMKPDDWALVLKINLEGAYHMSQPAAKAMMKKRNGRIINISSVVGLMGNAGQCNYAASKAGLIGMTKSMAKELGPRGITVNAIAPGFIRTPMTEALNDAQREILLKNVAIPRLGEPSDIGDAVVFLAGPGASYITGTVLNVSGGLYT